MAEIPARGETLRVEVQGWDKLWTFRSRFETPQRYVQGVRVFLDVPRPFERVILIDLAGEPYRRLVVEVEDPDAVVLLIRDAVSGSGPS